MNVTLGFVLDNNQIVPVWIAGQETQFGWINAVYQPEEQNGKEFLLFGLDEESNPIKDDGELMSPQDYWDDICRRRPEAKEYEKNFRKDLGG